MALALGAAGCQTLIGLEERDLANDPACIEYCDLVMTNCAGKYSVYDDRDSCLGVCRLLDKGDPANSSKTNTVACRTRQAAAALREPAAVCPLAGPGGGHECGSDCGSYCHLLALACPEQARGLSKPECLRQCGALRRSNNYNTSGLYATGDSLECRLVQLSAASSKPTEFCGNVSLAPGNPQKPCTDPANQSPRCEDYCRIVMTACTHEFRVYDSMKQCLSTCRALPAGTNADSGGVTDLVTKINSIGCRKFHAYSALTDPQVHCPHAGPTADGYCGDENTAICQSYCMIVKASCPGAFDMHSRDSSACEAECHGLGGATEEEAENSELRYSVATGQRGGATVPCRTLHAVLAFENPQRECPSALGAVPCNEQLRPRQRKR